MIFNSKDYYTKYINMLNYAISRVEKNSIEAAYKLIKKKILLKNNIFLCGNGGSAAISNHFVCDFQKGLSEIKNLQPKIISLSSNVPLITAIANDINFSDIFLEQFKNLYNKNDLLIIISSSGKSKNIEKLVNYANKKNVETIGLSGFDGGVLRKKSKIKIHVNSNNYGIIEDVHHILLHSLYQSIKVSLFKSKKKIRL